MSGDDRQNSPSISRQNRPSATISLFFFYIPRGLFKIDGLAGMLVLDPAKDAGGVLPEEKKKIGDGH